MPCRRSPTCSQNCGEWRHCNSRNCANASDTGYGYIQWKDEGPDSSKHLGHCVSAFVEKPTLEKARQYITRGDYFWNAGIFVATPQTILREIEETLPLLHRGLIQVRQVMGTGAFDKVLKEVYEGLESISFDYGVMEKTRSPVSVVPSDCGWSDVGLGSPFMK
jgi:mannose-1-phosphate guanylyltransferase